MYGYYFIVDMFFVWFDIDINFFFGFNGIFFIFLYIVCEDNKFIYVNKFFDWGVELEIFCNENVFIVLWVVCN